MQIHKTLFSLKAPVYMMQKQKLLKRYLLHDVQHTDIKVTLQSNHFSQFNIFQMFCLQMKHLSY